MHEGAAMTDGLVAVIGVSRKLLLSDGHSVGRVSSNGSKPGLAGKISADPNTLRSVTSESMDVSCISACVSNWVSGTWFIVLRVLTASISLNSMLNCAMVEASVWDRRLLETGGLSVRTEPDIVTVEWLYKVLCLSPKLGLAASLHNLNSHESLQN